RSADGRALMPGRARRPRAQRRGGREDGRRHRGRDAARGLLLRSAGPRQLGGGRRAVRLASHPRQRAIRNVLMTYSIVARDPHTGELGVAVQWHWFSVGPIVPL